LEKIIKINNIVIYRETIGNIRERGTSFRGHFEMRKKGKKSYTSTVANDLVIVVPKCTYLPPHKTSTPSLVNSKVIQINKRKGITKIETQEIHSRHYTSKLIAFNMLVQTTLGGDEGLG
jgi:hypothetical protein